MQDLTLLNDLASEITAKLNPLNNLVINPIQNLGIEPPPYPGISDKSSAMRVSNTSMDMVRTQLTTAYMPTIAECAIFALDAYNESHRSPIDGWSVSAVSPKNRSGYYAKCYIKGTWPFTPGIPVSVVIAHRGTVPTNIHNLLTDIKVAAEDLGQDSALDSMYQFIWGEHNCLAPILSLISNGPTLNKDSFDKSVIVNVGHSLGGIFSDFLAYSLFDSQSRLAGIGSASLYGDPFLNKKSITFENPGSKNIITKIFNNTLRINCSPITTSKYASYNADVNFINCCNENSGKTYRLIDLPYDYKGSLDPRLNSMSELYYKNPYYVIYSIQQHDIKNIVDYLLKGGKTIEYAYPVGFQPSYIAYLNGDERKEYWEGFYKTLWETDDLLKPMYNWNFNNYFYSKMEDLAKIRDNAIINHSKEPKSLLVLTPTYNPYLEITPQSAIKNSTFVPVTPVLSPIYIPTSEKTHQLSVNNNSAIKTPDLKPIYNPPSAALISKNWIFAHNKQLLSSAEKSVEDLLEDFVVLETHKSTSSSNQLKNTKKSKIKCSVM